jgi:hypothetical protein
MSLRSSLLAALAVAAAWQAASAAPPAPQALAAPAAPAAPAAMPASAPLDAVARLGEANGLALACGAKEISARARQLMLDFSPRTSEFGTAFEQATHKAFVAQLNSKRACPASGELALRVESSATILRAQAPAAE